MSPTTGTTDAATRAAVGHGAAGVLLLAVLTAAAYHAWLGWGGTARRRPDLLTGSTSVPGEWWHVVGFLGTLAVLVVIAARLLPAWVPVAVVPPVVLVTFSASQFTEDAFWSIAAAILTACVAIGSGAFALATHVVRSSRTRSRAAPILEP